MALAVAGFVLGAVIGAFFKVVLLVPTLVVTVVVIGAGCVALGMSGTPTVMAILIAAAAVESGYLAAMLVRLLRYKMYEKRGGAANEVGVEGSPPGQSRSQPA